MHHKQYDPLFIQIADYLTSDRDVSPLALETARYCLADSLGCALLSLQYPACAKHLGPFVKGTIVPKGSRIPGTPYILDPIRAAFNIGTMIRWLDYNDTWLAAEWGHPSDNLGGLIAIADFLCQNGREILVIDLLKAMIQAYEIQGILSLSNSFNQVGLDHVILVKIATCAVVTKLMGGTHQDICNALSHAFIDGGPLRVYRHYPNTGPRKSWAAGDQTSRGLLFAWMTIHGELGYPSALSVPTWGFQEVLFRGEPLKLSRQFGCYVMEHILFKVSFPAEFHAQTAVEAAILLHPKIKDRLHEIHKIIIETQVSAIRIIDKKGPLTNPADRDHCIQYMVAIGLLFGELTANHYEEFVAKDSRIDHMRRLMRCEEKKEYSIDYLDPEKRSIANAIIIHFIDGTSEKAEIEYPIGHKKRRKEGIPLLFKKFHDNIVSLFPERADDLTALFQNKTEILKFSVSGLVDKFI